MKLLARLMSHGFAIALVVLLAIGFIYRGELFPDWELPDFLVFDADKGTADERQAEKIEPAPIQDERAHPGAPATARAVPDVRDDSTGTGAASGEMSLVEEPAVDAGEPDRASATDATVAPETDTSVIGDEPVVDVDQESVNATAVTPDTGDMADAPEGTPAADVEESATPATEAADDLAPGTAGPDAGMSVESATEVLASAVEQDTGSAPASAAAAAAAVGTVPYTRAAAGGAMVRTGTTTEAAVPLAFENKVSATESAVIETGAAPVAEVMQDSAAAAPDGSRVAEINEAAMLATDATESAVIETVAAPVTEPMQDSAAAAPDGSRVAEINEAAMLATDATESAVIETVAAPVTEPMQDSAAATMAATDSAAPGGSQIVEGNEPAMPAAGATDAAMSGSSGLAAVSSTGMFSTVQQDSVSEPVAAVATEEAAAPVQVVGEGAQAVRAPAPHAAPDPAVSSYQLLASAREAFWLRDYQAAEDYYQQIVQNDPDNPDGYGELANMYFSQGNWDAAASAYYEAGTRLVKSGKLASATELVEVIRGLNGSQADALEREIQTARGEQE